MSFTDDERAELIAALSRTTDMVSNVLDALDVMRVALEAVRRDLVQPVRQDDERYHEDHHESDR